MDNKVSLTRRKQKASTASGKIFFAAILSMALLITTSLVVMYLRGYRLKFEGSRLELWQIIQSDIAERRVFPR